MGFLSLVGWQDTFFENNFWNITVLWFCLDPNSQSLPCGPWWFGGSGILGMMASHSEMFAMRHHASHFLFLPANSKTCLHSWDIVIFGTDPFRREVFQLEMQPCSFSILSLTKTWIPFALQKSCGPFKPELHILWCFLDSLWLLRTNRPFLRSSSVSSILIFIDLALQYSHETLVGTIVPWKKHEVGGCITVWPQTGHTTALGLCFFTGRHMDWIKLCLRGPSYWGSMLWSVGTFKSPGTQCSVEN